MPPHSELPEQSVLSCIFRDPNECFPESVMKFGKAKETCFYDLRHQVIYRAMCEMYEQAMPIDVITVQQHLINSQKLDQVGGITYLLATQDLVPSCANLNYYLGIVYDKYLLRTLVHVATNLVSRVYEFEGEVHSLLDEAEREILAIRTYAARQDGKGVKELVTGALRDFEVAYEKKNIVDGLPTGLRELDSISGGMHRGEMIVIAGFTSQGKCLAPETPVLRYDGMVVRADSLERGDLLMGPDSLPRRILNTTFGTDEMYRIDQAFGDSYSVNSKHILSLQETGRFTRQRKYLGGRIKNISIEDYMRSSNGFKRRAKGYKAAVEYPELPTPLDPYFIGLWLGDGTATKPDITSADAEIIAWLQSYAAKLGVDCMKAKSKGCFRVSLVNKKRRRFCKVCGRPAMGGALCSTHYVQERKRTGKRSLRIINPVLQGLKGLNIFDNKHIPARYMINSQSIRLQVLAGLIDADGYLDPTGTDMEICLADPFLAKQVCHLARSLGFRSQVRPKTTSIKSTGYKGEAWRVCIGGRLSTIPVKLPRKRGRDSARTSLRNSITVTPIGRGQYFGFELSGDGLFLLGDHTVTHNSSLVMNIAEHVLLDCKEPVGVFSLEMTAEQLIKRCICSHARVNLRAVREGRISPEDFTSLANSAGKLSTCALHFDDTRGLSVLELRARARRMKQRYGIKLLVIDLIQHLLGDKGRRYEKKQEELEDVSRTIQAMASELDLPILAVSQLNDQGKLFGSRTIGHDADSVWKLERQRDKDTKSEDNAIPVTLKVLKNRNGPTGLVPLMFIRPYTRFETAAREQEAAAADAQQDLYSKPHND